MMNSQDSFPDPQNLSVMLILDYLPPSQLVYRHWTAKHRDKKKAMIALSWALSCFVAEYSTKTMPTQLVSRLQTAFAKSILFLTTRKGQLRSQLSNERLTTAIVNALKSQSLGPEHDKDKSRHDRW